MSSIESPSRFQFQNNKIVYDQICEKVTYSYFTEINRNGLLLHDLDTLASKCNNECFLVNRFQETMT